MQDKIEIMDRDRNTKAIYILSKEESLEDDCQKQYNTWLEWLVASIFKIFKLCLYLIISFLKLIIKVIEGLFLQGYEPFKSITDKYQERQDKKAKDYIIKNTKPHATITHNYEFIRNKVFARNYVKIDTLLDQCVKHEAELNEDLHKDIIKRLNIILVEAERQALSEGYKYAKESHFKFESTEAFDKYIQDRVLRGEDYREDNRKLLEEFEESND